jgi:rare lipoprotein A
MNYSSRSWGVGATLAAKVFAVAAIAMVTTGLQEPPAAAAAIRAPVLQVDAAVAPHAAKPPLDFSGNERIGVASFYANWFAGRRMANGIRMNPQGINAASRTLPLGTVAKVINLKTHKSAIVRIEDRGPYVQGRIVDLSPFIARKIGITRRMGIAKVRVVPISIPLPNGLSKVARQSPKTGRSHWTLMRTRPLLADRIG